MRIIFALLLAAAALPAKATPLLPDGGFEKGLGPWVLGPGTQFVTVLNQPFDGFSAHKGQAYALLGTRGTDGTLSQTLADVPGETLDLSFFWAADGRKQADFTAAFDGRILFSETNPPAAGWEHVTATLTGTGRDTISFSFRNDPGYLALDSVQIRPVLAQTPASVPEPASAGLLGIGACLFALRRQTAAGALRRIRSLSVFS